jgi:phytoene/squalene synthetase
MSELNLNELKALWGKLLGEIPSEQQWTFWAMSHSVEVIRHGILKTAQKNLSTGGTMSADHKIRFASKVMITATTTRQVNAENRERLNREMEQKVGAA